MATLQQIEKTFGMPLHQAALVLNCSIEDLRSICRTYGIKRWPFRKRTLCLQGLRRNSVTLSTTNTSFGTEEMTSPVKAAMKKKQIPNLFNNFSVEPEVQVKWFDETIPSDKKESPREHSLTSSSSGSSSSSSQLKEVLLTRQLQPHPQNNYKQFQSKFNIQVKKNNNGQSATAEQSAYNEGNANKQVATNESSRKRRVYNMVDHLSPANKVSRNDSNSVNRTFVINQATGASLKHQFRPQAQQENLPVQFHANQPQQNAQVTKPVPHRAAAAKPFSMEVEEHSVQQSSNNSTPTMVQDESTVSVIEDEIQDLELPSMALLMKEVHQHHSKETKTNKSRDEFHARRLVSLPSIKELMNIAPHKSDIVGL